jgi:putative effector of murein hydrolase
MIYGTVQIRTVKHNDPIYITVVIAAVPILCVSWFNSQQRITKPIANKTVTTPANINCITDITVIA